VIIYQENLEGVSPNKLKGFFEGESMNGKRGGRIKGPPLFVFLGFALLLASCPRTDPLSVHGGMKLKYQVNSAVSGDDLSSFQTLISKRLKTNGFSDPIVDQIDIGKITVGIPGAVQSDLVELRTLIEGAAVVKFRLVADEKVSAKYEMEEPPEAYQWLVYEDDPQRRELILVDDGANFGSEVIEKAEADHDEVGYPAIHLAFSRKYHERMFKFTQANSEESLGFGKARKYAIILGDKILSAPVIKSGIRDAAVITGGVRGFSKEKQTLFVLIFNCAKNLGKITFLGAEEIKPEDR
jgi:preprotein translocase subunit SecD